MPRISELDPGVALAGPEFFPADQGPNTLRFTPSQVAAYIVATQAGIGPNLLLQLDENGQLPAVDGHNLTNLPSGFPNLIGEVTTATNSHVSNVTRSIAPIWSALHTFATGVLITGPVQSGAFNCLQVDDFIASWADNTHATDGVIVNLNSFPKTAYFGSNTIGVHSPFTSAVDIPTTSLLTQVNAISGYCRVGGSVTLGVGVFGVGLLSSDTALAVPPTGNGVWAGNFVASNSPTTAPVSNTGFNFGQIAALEIDVNIMKRAGIAPQGNCQGLYINSGSEVQSTGQYYGILMDYGGAVPFFNGLVFADGCANNAAIFLGASTRGNGVPSLPIKFSTRNAGGGTLTGQVYLDVNGNFNFSAPINQSGKLTTVASTAASAGFNIPSGVAPTSPVGGDIWNDGTNIGLRVGGATDAVALLAAAQTLANKTLTAPQMTSPNVTSGAYKILNSPRLVDNAGYTQIQESTGTNAIAIGGADPATYYRNTTHSFGNPSGTVYATLTSAGMLPGADNVQNLGSASLRWANIRAAAGVFTTNVSANLFSANVLQAVGNFTVAALPAGVLGYMTYVSDGTASLAWGATVTGGGSTKYLVWYNGTAYTVIGK